MRREMKALADGVVEIVKGYVQQAQASLIDRLDGIERKFAELPSPKDGADGKDGLDGKDALPVDADEIASKVLALIPAPPVPVDGKDGVDGQPGVNGKDADPVDTAAVIAAVLAQVPVPANGADGKNGTDGVPGADGKSFTVDEAKALLEPELAKWELDFERRAHETLQKTIDRFPKPRDGTDGKDGIDAIGFDHLTVEHDGERGFTLKFMSGERTKEFSFSVPVVLDAGFFREGDAYEKGDGVTFGGSYWIAQSITRTKPEIGNEDWRLAVRKGRDGKREEKVDLISAAGKKSPPTI